MLKMPSLEEMKKATWFSHLTMSKSRKGLDKSVACSKRMGRIRTGVALLCIITVEINMALPSPQKLFQKESLKKKASRILFLNIKKMVFVSLCEGEIENHSIVKISTAKTDNPHTSPVGNSFSNFGSQM